MNEDKTEEKQESSQLESSPVKTLNQRPTKIIANETQNKKVDVPIPLRKVLSYINISINFFLCIFTLALVFVSYYQWKTINRQADIMSQQTTLMRQQLVGSQAALLILNVSLSDLGELGVGIINDGHVTATDIHCRLEAIRERLATGSPIGQPILFEQNVPPIPAKRDFPINRHLSWGTQLTRLYEWPKNWPGKKIFTVRAECKYQNGFGDVAWAEYCHKWLPNYFIKTPLGDIRDGGLRYSCIDNINITINDILERKRKADQEK